MNEASLNLPRSAGAWTQSGGPQFVGPQDIFNYMDGAGELYLGYRFKRLEVHRYASPDQGEILVELYWMESSDDAYGLLSGDWGGEAVDLHPPPGSSSNPGKSKAGFHASKPKSGLPGSLRTPSPAAADGPRALYGGGLLRLWSGNLFARVVADRETDASKNAVQVLGQAIAAGRPTPPQPALIRALHARVGTRFSLRPEHVTFLRSHLVLNSVYFLSSENLLDLGPDCEVAAASYGQGSGKLGQKSVRLLLIRYANQAGAAQALQHFQKIYLPEKSNGPKTSLTGDRAPGKPVSGLLGLNGVAAIEDGWMGFAGSGRGLALVFESPDEASAWLFLNDSSRIFENLEASRE